MKNRADERQYISKEQLLDIEKTLIRQDHVRRYASIRRFCYGDVLDLACGSGYGSCLISGNPDVSHVTGADIDAEAITCAIKEFTNKKTSFIRSAPEKITETFDTLVCIETIEHIQDLKTIPDLVRRCRIDNIILSFPDKKTLHYNKHHKHDFVRQDIVDMFPDHVMYHVIRFTDSTALFMTRHPKMAPHYLFRNIRDL